jgi:hypothetical protein
VVVHLAEFGDYGLHESKVALDIWDTLQRVFHLGRATESLDEIPRHDRTVFEPALDALLVRFVRVVVRFFMTSRATLGVVSFALTGGEGL